MDAFITYLRSLRPDQLKRIKAGWRVSVDRIEDAHPAIAGWTRSHRLPRLITIGIFSVHPRTGVTPLMVAIRDQLREKVMRQALDGSLDRLENILREGVAYVPDYIALDHGRLLRDLCSWDHPKHLVQNRWRCEFYGRNHES